MAIQPDDHKDLPFEGGSEPVPQVKDPVPGPGRGVMHWVVIGTCVVIAAMSLVWVVGW